eukprot:3667712-Rhodomonas_salina.1
MLGLEDAPASCHAGIDHMGSGVYTVQLVDTDLAGMAGPGQMIQLGPGGDMIMVPANQLLFDGGLQPGETIQILPGVCVCRDFAVGDGCVCVWGCGGGELCGGRERERERERQRQRQRQRERDRESRDLAVKGERMFWRLTVGLSVSRFVCLDCALNPPLLPAIHMSVSLSRLSSQSSSGADHHHHHARVCPLSGGDVIIVTNDQLCGSDLHAPLKAVAFPLASLPEGAKVARAGPSHFLLSAHAFTLATVEVSATSLCLRACWCEEVVRERGNAPRDLEVCV